VGALKDNVRTKRHALIGALFAVLAGCAHQDPYEKYDEARDKPDARRLMPQSSAEIKRIDEPIYAGQLRARLGQADDLRLALLMVHSTMLQERYAYNSAAIIAAPLVIATKVASDDLAKIAAVFGVAYLLQERRPANSGTLYLEGARRIGCLIEEYRNLLYSETEFKQLQSVASSLHSSVASFENQASQTVSKLSTYQPKAPDVTCVQQGSALCSLRRTAQGKQTPAKPSVSELESIIVSQRKVSWRKLDLLDKVIASIETGNANDLYSKVQGLMIAIDGDIANSQLPLARVNFDASVNQPAEDSSDAPAAESTPRPDINRLSAIRRDANFDGAIPQLAGLKEEDIKSYNDSIAMLRLDLFNTDHMISAYNDRIARSQRSVRALSCGPTVKPVKLAPSTGAASNG
jgi:hypothetical protein